MDRLTGGMGVPQDFPNARQGLPPNYPQSGQPYPHHADMGSIPAGLVGILHHSAMAHQHNSLTAAVMQALLKHNPQAAKQESKPAGHSGQGMNQGMNAGGRGHTNAKGF